MEASDGGGHKKTGEVFTLGDFMKKSSGRHGIGNQSRGMNPWNRGRGRRTLGESTQEPRFERVPMSTQEENAATCSADLKAHALHEGSSRVSCPKGRGSSKRSSNDIKLGDFISNQQQEYISVSKGAHISTEATTNCWSRGRGHSTKGFSSRSRRGAMQGRDNEEALGRDGNQNMDISFFSGSSGAATCDGGTSLENDKYDCSNNSNQEWEPTLRDEFSGKHERKIDKRGVRFRAERGRGPIGNVGRGGKILNGERMQQSANPAGYQQKKSGHSLTLGDFLDDRGTKTRSASQAARDKICVDSDHWQDRNIHGGVQGRRGRLQKTGPTMTDNTVSHGFNTTTADERSADVKRNLEEGCWRSSAFKDEENGSKFGGDKAVKYSPPHLQSSRVGHVGSWRNEGSSVKKQSHAQTISTNASIAASSCQATAQSGFEQGYRKSFPVLNTQRGIGGSGVSNQEKYKPPHLRTSGKQDDDNWRSNQSRNIHTAAIPRNLDTLGKRRDRQTGTDRTVTSRSWRNNDGITFDEDYRWPDNVYSNENRLSSAVENIAVNIDYQRLKELSEIDPDDLASKLIDSKDTLINLLKISDAKGELVQLLVKTLLKINESSTRSDVLDVMSSLTGSQLLKTQLPKIFQKLPLQDDIVEDKGRFLDEVLALFEIFGEAFPSSAIDLPMAELMLVLSRLDLDDKEEQLLRVTDLVNKREQQLKEKMKRQVVMTRTPNFGPDGPPPEDYRSLSVVPTASDLTPEKEPYLRPIKTQGKYSDGEEYLDIQFRLLKEDLVAPLREGIGEIMMHLSREERKHNIKLYKGVRIISPIFDRGGMTHRIKFDVSRLQRVNWEHSKRLIFGTLLCFSADNFKTSFFAIVVKRELDDLKIGDIDVKFLGEINEKLFDLESQEIYNMVESPTYFEAYRHVLAALQMIDAESIPLADYIISAANEVQVPKYLRDKDELLYDLRGCLTENNEKCEIKLSEIQDWEDKTVLNRSQLLAVEEALSREFVIIQGPPGTGKTFVGLKITHALLQNKQAWRGQAYRGKSPILIVCYTNHALDQFVEGVLDMGHRNIVRVGGRCQNAAVANCKLTRSSEFSPGKESILIEKEQTRKKICNVIEYLEGIKQLVHIGKILPLEALLRFLPPDLKEWFECLNITMSRNHIITFLEAFLGIFPVPLEMEEHICIETKIMQRHHKHRQETLKRENDEKSRNYDNTVDELTETEQEADFVVDQVAVNGDAFAPLPRLLSSYKEDVEGEEETGMELYDAQGFEYVTSKKYQHQRRAFARHMFNITLPMTEENAHGIADPMKLNMNERWMFYRYLVRKLEEHCRREFARLGQIFEDRTSQVKEIEENDDESSLKQAGVIAMTTTCAAKYRRVLERIKPKIIIIEEAAEVLEAHVITSITDGAEHLILIGDHKQLRPNTSVYDLAKRYNLQLSLFERMIDNGMECHSLDLQHRMRPEISLVMKDIYPTLKDHPSVLQHPDIKGVSCNLFFIDHKFTEQEDKDLRSKSNAHEANYIVALCWYLLLQGYKPTQITILTLYTGQLTMLKKLMPRTKFEGVRVAAVDNFQGEENDIVLLSIVRSNEESKVGFSGVENRICVALSRAKQGLFVIGNFALLACKSSMWDKIITKAIARKQIGKCLRLYCRNHPEKLIDASNAEDFQRAPDGGCKEPCFHRLQCGHLCQKSCHPTDQEHVAITCQKLCNKLLCADKGHRCQKKCHFGDDCGPCMVKVEKIIPCCNHEQMVECSIDASDFKCLVLVEKELFCGHKAKIACGANINEFNCTVSCEVILACGHTCKGDCSTCHQGRLHKRCDEPCTRVLVCSHVCKELCSFECPPCREFHNYVCQHKKGNFQCGDETAQCKKSLTTKCSHGQIFNICQEQYEREPCNMPCTKQIAKCGHQCIGLCNEQCPSLCRICDQEEIRKICTGTEKLENARFLQLTECSHVFEMNYLDEWMQKKPSAESGHVIGMKRCPNCATPIRISPRYGQIINRQLAEVAVVKKAVVAQRSRVIQRFRNVADRSGLAYQYSSMKRDNLQLIINEKCKRLNFGNLSKIWDTVIGVQIEFLERICSIMNHSRQCCSDEQWGEMVTNLVNICVQNNITNQQLLDVELEIDRLTVLTVIKASSSYMYKEHDVAFSADTIDQLKYGKRISKDELARMYANIRVLKIGKLFDLWKWNVSQERLAATRKGFAAEHWFKCLNCHINPVDECTAQQTEPICRECTEDSDKKGTDKEMEPEIGAEKKSDYDHRLMIRKMMEKSRITKKSRRILGRYSSTNRRMKITVIKVFKSSESESDPEN